MKPTLTVVVPVGALDNSWHGLLPQLQHVVADDIALVLPIDRMGDAIPLADERLMLMFSPLGRARQLNAGAKATRSDWLWFLDSSSRLEPATVRSLNAFVASGSSAPEILDLRGANSQLPRTTPISIRTRLTRRWASPVMNNQGLFMQRRMYEAIGGFDESLEVGVDRAFLLEAREFGIPLQNLPTAVFAGPQQTAEHRGRRATMEHPRQTRRPTSRFLRADVTP
ncbi:hypothetical protein [Dokdonella sp.]|uniref:hypothetical protein n=1 Tax=Dokdonella sp. TaxID=2291710 RepID=UPI003C3BE5C6